MKQYIITGALALGVILLIVATTLLTLKSFEIGGLSILSIEDMRDKNDELDIANVQLGTTKKQYDAANNNLDVAKKEYVEAQNAYNNITDEKIEMIKEATKEQRYQVEWLWIVLGEYAIENNLTMGVIEPRKGDQEIGKGTVQINLVGRYLDISNFVFEVENDNSLMFKLDNMVMEYVKDNKVSATFDVLSMGVLF